jgi:hypothetical protein
MHDVRVAVGGGSASRGATPTFARCGRCGADYDEASWHALEVLRRVTTDEVRALVTAWPGGASIEVRGCTRCHGAIARKHG